MIDVHYVLACAGGHIPRFYTTTIAKLYQSFCRLGKVVEFKPRNSWMQLSKRIGVLAGQSARGDFEDIHK